MLLALVVNGAFLLVAALAAMSDGVAMPGRICAALVAVALAVCLCLLVLARARRLPGWGLAAMRYLSYGVPVFWLLGSVDRGTISGQEAAFLGIVVLLAYATWRVFKSLHTIKQETP